ncbi:hypothetical protein QUF58_06020 [Anaerolineales bacterium HSG24]|nr:hypothetical protein [Anaerolineales bacterium HSG24]
MNRTIPPAIAAIAPDGKLTPAQKRHLIINLSLKRAKPGTGSCHEFLRRRTAMKLWPDLRPILQDITWVIVGDVATRAYMPERETKDLDILVHHEDGEETIERLQAAGYRIISRLAVPGYLLMSPEGIQLDVIFGDYPWLKQALQNHHQDKADYPVLGLSYLVLMKTVAGRIQDTADVSRMLGLATDEELNQVRAVVKRYEPEAVDDLESMIYLGQLEMQFPDDHVN